MSALQALVRRKAIEAGISESVVDELLGDGLVLPGTRLAVTLRIVLPKQPIPVSVGEEL